MGLDNVSGLPTPQQVLFLFIATLLNNVFICLCVFSRFHFYLLHRPMDMTAECLLAQLLTVFRAKLLSILVRMIYHIFANALW